MKIFLPKKIYIFKILAIVGTITLSLMHQSYAAEITESDTTNSRAYSSFQKSDASLIYEIETQLKKSTYTSKDGEPREIELPPKQRRFNIAKKGLNKLILKDAVPNTLVGGIIGAVATVHPAGLLLGGIAGTLQGKSKRYEEAQGKLHRMEKEIFLSKDYDVTPEEIRLSKYTGADLSEFLALAPIIETPIGITQVDEEIMSEPKIEQTPPPILAHCYGNITKDSSTMNALSRRKLASQCFYHMN